MLESRLKRGDDGGEPFQESGSQMPAVSSRLEMQESESFWETQHLWALKGLTASREQRGVLDESRTWTGCLLGGKWWLKENRFAEGENFLFFQHVLHISSLLWLRPFPFLVIPDSLPLSPSLCQTQKTVLIFQAQSVHQWILTPFLFLFYPISIHFVFCLCCSLSLH